MERISKILEDRRFKEALAKIRLLEQGRVFCGHDFDHLADVSRIAWIYVLENHLDFDKSVIYAAGLLHDIGKFRQYKEKIPHHLASAQIAAEIMKDAGYDGKETALVTEAILHHRTPDGSDRTTLNYILYMADKKSRNCFLCGARQACDWPEAMKNKGIAR